MGWRNFRIWRGRLPHWRADDVMYFVTFRYREPLDQGHRDILLREILRSNGSKWSVLAACVLQGDASMIVIIEERPSRRTPELSQLVESAKNRAAKRIAASGGPGHPFYSESFDRIIRDGFEYEERLGQITQSADSPDVGIVWTSPGLRP